jgi:patatin-like phospholipase/acyl hydrolase
MGDSFRILAIDGGGIKGLFSAAVLAHLEEDLSIRVVDYFDLIVGTSTGGIIALALGKGLPAQKILQFYIDKGSKIFERDFLYPVKHLIRSAYSASKYEAILKECFGKTRLGESQTRLVIPSYNLDSADVYLLKTAHHRRFRRDYKEYMWKIARATTAAPTYFCVSKNIENMRLIDGGVWANNPSMVAVVEAVKILEKSTIDICLFSLGTTQDLSNRSQSLDNGGLWAWKDDIVEVVFEAQSAGIARQTALLLGNNYLRLSPKVPQDIFKIDIIDEKKLRGLANFEGRKIAPKFKKMFLSKKAAVFKPFYKLQEEKNDC